MTAPITELVFYKCHCGLETTWAEGKCKRCGKSLMGCPIVGKKKIEPKADTHLLNAAEIKKTVEKVGFVPPPKTAARTNIKPEDDMSAIVAGLAKVAISVTLPFVATWPPELRKETVIFLEKGGPVPEDLRSYLNDDTKEIEKLKKMNQEASNYRIKMQKKCSVCSGDKKKRCSKCDGTGWVNVAVTISRLKELLS